MSVRHSGFQRQRTRRQCHSRPPSVCASCPRESVPVSQTVPEAWRAQYFISGDNSSGEARDINSGRVSGIFRFYCVCVCVCVLLSCQHFFQPKKKTEVYFVLQGPELNCLLRQCPLTSVLQAEAGHRVSGAGGEEDEMEGHLGRTGVSSCSLFPSLSWADGKRTRSLGPRGRGAREEGLEGSLWFLQACPASREPPCSCSPRTQPTHTSHHTHRGRFKGVTNSTYCRTKGTLLSVT